MKTAVVAVAILACHYGYFLAPDARAEEEWFYVLRGIEGTVAFLALATLTRSFWLQTVALWGALENLQTALCGFIELDPDAELGMCLELVGPFPYAAAAAAALVYIVRRLWPPYPPMQ